MADRKDSDGFYNKMKSGYHRPKGTVLEKITFKCGNTWTFVWPRPRSIYVTEAVAIGAHFLNRRRQREDEKLGEAPDFRVAQRPRSGKAGDD